MWKDKVRLAYPAPPVPVPEGEYRFVIAQRDPRGVITSMRLSDSYNEPLLTGEIRLRLMPAAGAWGLPIVDHLAKVRAGSWKNATYLEVRLDHRHTGVPAGIADADRRPIGDAR